MRYTEKEIGQLVKAIRTLTELHIRSPSFRAEEVAPELKSFSTKVKENAIILLFHHPTGSARAAYSSEGTMAQIALEAALSFASGGPGFAPLSLEELDDLRFHVSILEDKTELPGSPAKRKESVELGRHGLIVEYGTHRASVFPSFAAERGLDKTGLFERICTTAGLPKGYWKQPKVRFYKFETQSFIEERQSGNMMRA